MPDLLVGVQGEPVAGQPDIAGGDDREQLAFTGLVQPRLNEPLPLEVQLGLAHGPFEPQQQPIIVQARIVDAVLVGQEGVEDRAPFQEMIPVGIGPGQPANLETKEDADVIQIHLGHDPSKVVPALGTGAASTLIAGDDDYPVWGPSPGDGEIAQLGLDLSRLFVEQDLMSAGLAHINDGQPFEVPGLDLGRSSWGAEPPGERRRRS